MAEKRTYTQDELTILEANGTPKERMDEGELLPGELWLLDALAQAQEYLAGRYPQETFTFTGIEYCMLGMSQVSLIASPDDAAQESFAVRVKGEKAPFALSESHFNDVKRGEAAAMVEQALVGLGVQAACDLEITGLYGEECDPAKTLEQLLAQGVEIPLTGWAFALEGELPPAEQMREAIRALGFTGGIRLRTVSGVTLEEAMSAPRTDRSFVAQETYLSLAASSQGVK